MSERRPMRQALQTVDLPAGALDFIKAGAPRPVTRLKVSEAASIPSGLAAPSAPVAAAPNFVASDPGDAGRPATKPDKPRLLREKELELLPQRNLVNLSIRVHPDIPDALLRASTARKLKRLKARTQQDIAAEALTQWLTQNGFLP